MNRVYCLYRVFTVQQLHEDDIPMQRQACREFAAVRVWEIIKKFSEKEISGFKISTADRRVLQQNKKDANHKISLFLNEKSRHRETSVALELPAFLCACFLVDSERFQIPVLLVLPCPYKAHTRGG